MAVGNRKSLTFMSIAPDNCRSGIQDSRLGQRRIFEIPKSLGFTLLEIILAMAILGMMSLAIYRFVQSNLIAVYTSSQVSAAEAPYSELRDFEFRPPYCSRAKAEISDF